MARPVARSVIRVGTRGSRLALIQSEWIIERLRAELPEAEIGATVIATTGDRSASAPRGEGVFVKEIQRALLEGHIDLAVHSLKDLPTEPAEGLRLAAVPPRADPRDALVGARLVQLQDGDRVGTGSPRRSAQLRRLRPNLEVVPIRGNLPTRVEKARSGEVAAVMLAVAGLARLEVEPDEVFDIRDILPAPGQGALAVEVRAEDQEMAELVGRLDDPETRGSVGAERAVLREMGGGCLLPVGAFARIEGDALIVDAAVVSADGTREARARGEGNPAEPDEIAKRVAADLVASGALDLL
jgi:hydroxymethylbilane synthase